MKNRELSKYLLDLISETEEIGVLDASPSDEQLEDYMLGVADADEAALVEKALLTSNEVCARLRHVQEILDAPLKPEEQQALDRALEKLDEFWPGSGSPRPSDTHRKFWTENLVFNTAQRRQFALAVFAPREQHRSFAGKTEIGPFEVLLREDLPLSAVSRNEPGSPEPAPHLTASVFTDQNPGVRAVTLSINCEGISHKRQISLTNTRGDEWLGQADFGEMGSFRSGETMYDISQLELVIQ